MEKLLAGQTAVITGATSGIGRAAALLFAREGAAIGACGRRREALASLAEEIAAQGGACATLAGDGAERDFPARLAALAEERFGGASILVCSAGMALRAPTLEMTREEWDRVMELNLTFPMVLSQLIIPQLRRRGGGKIVYISSTAGRSVNMGASPSYGASKAGLLYLTRHLATEFAGDHIYVNAICPGPVDTEITHTWTPEHRQKVLSSLPMGRMGTAEDIAACALFLASSMSDYITGEAILANGGRFMM